MAWDLCHFNFSALRCSKLLDGGLQGLRIRRRCGQEGDELIQADVTKEMAFKEGGGEYGPQKVDTHSESAA